MMEGIGVIITYCAFIFGNCWLLYMCWVFYYNVTRNFRLNVDTISKDVSEYVEFSVEIHQF